MEYLVLTGDVAYTSTEAKKIAYQINHASVKVESVSASWIYYVQLKDDSRDVVSRDEVFATEAKLRELLPGSQSHNAELEARLANPEPNSKVYYVTPRNISPWSSKATSIAHVCGRSNFLSI
jgi:phosphoribosylformylglycinamidine synthase